MTVTPTSAPSSASGLIAAGQASRGEAARQPFEPFVLPAMEPAQRRPVAPTEAVETAASTMQPTKFGTAPAKGNAASTNDMPKDGTDSKTSAATGSSALVGLQENTRQENSEGDGASDQASAVTQASEAAVKAEATATADTSQVQLVDAVVSVQLVAQGELALAAAGTQREGADDAVAIKTQAGEQISSKIALALPAGKEDTARGDAASATKALADGVPKPGLPTGTTAAANAEKSAPELPSGSAPDAAPADKTAEQANTAAAAKNELVAKLDQVFGQPQAKPAEATAAPLPPQAAPSPHELPKAIPPSAVPIEIGLRSLQGLREFQIRLDPAELGRVDVKLEISDDNKVTARVVVDRVETLHLLQREAKTLERAFEQAGLKSSDAGVEISLRDPGQQADQRRRDGQSDDTENGQAGGRANKAAPVDLPVIPIRRTLHVGALDRSI